MQSIEITGQALEGLRPVSGRAPMEAGLSVVEAQGVGCRYSVLADYLITQVIVSGAGPDRVIGTWEQEDAFAQAALIEQLGLWAVRQSCADLLAEITSF